jgi:NitT/TauT family transport system permease protein/taurine transport system permease protein
MPAIEPTARIATQARIHPGLRLATGARRWLWRLLHTTGAFLILIAIWALISHFAHLPDYFLPSPLVVAGSIGDLMAKGILTTHVRASLAHLFMAALIGIAVAVPLGLAIGLNRHASRFFYPLFNFFQSISGIAWTPLLIIWFGFSDLTIIVVVNYTVLFPVVFNTMIGARTVPRTYINAVLTLGGSRWRVVWDVIVPGALPNIVTGVRLGLAYGWRALIAAEMLVAANGLGYMIFSAQSSHLTSRIIVGMVIIGLLWMFIDQFLLRPLEEATIQRWGMVHR